MSMGQARKKVRKVLLIGGSLDGTWREQPEEAGPYIRVMKKADLTLESFNLNAGIDEPVLPVPEFEQYYLEKIAIYGEGIWVAIETTALREANLQHFMGPEPRVAMILKAILQRDAFNAAMGK